MRRTMLGLSQKDLAKGINVSVQQIQKYEKATNHISCSKLYFLSKILNVPIGYFFDHLDEWLVSRNYSCEEEYSSQNYSLHEESAVFEVNYALELEIKKLIYFFKKIPNNTIRAKVLEIVEILAYDYIIIAFY